jgi:two-component system sensor histidine kinase PilS (NtrC family)
MPTLTDTANDTLQLQQQTGLYRVYSWYRVALGLLLLTAFFSSWEKPLIGGGAPALFLWLTSLYLSLSLLPLILPRILARRNHQLLFFAIDIAFIVALSHISGGVTGGLAPLLLVAVAAAAMLLRRQLALLVAAIATLALLGDTFYLITRRQDDTGSLLTCATLGILAFATSISFQFLSQRLRTTQLLALQRAADVSKLQHLNALIVQRMRTGILVIDPIGQIKMMNDAATELLDARSLRRQLERGLSVPLMQPLREQLMSWRDNPYVHLPTLQLSHGGPELIARFTSLNDDIDADTVIFLEDHGQIAQRAQQLKLAALGRLTASIAHEIRNPLGAVSHAAQLLLESNDLTAADRRLADIVQNHAKRMNSIIESVLQLSRRTPPNPQRLDLRQWLTTFVRDYQQGRDQPGEIHVDCTQPVEINVDASQLGQVLTNLLDNALRYSEKQTGKARADLKVHRNAAGLARLDIIDDGPGISDSEREKIFEPFFTTEAKGNGLGLFIARELCEINQTQISWLRTEDGRSCFRLSFSHPDRRPLVNE